MTKYPETSGPFSRDFLPELQEEFLSYLSSPDLKNCSLVSGDLGQEASRLLWRSLVLSPERLGKGGLARFAEMVLATPARAVNTRRLSILSEREAALAAGFIPSEQDEVSWRRIEQAFSLFRGLNFMRLITLECGRWIPKRFLAILARSLNASPIRTFVHDLPPVDTTQIYNAWPYLTTISSRRRFRSQEYPNVSSSVLPRLRQIECNSVDTLVQFTQGREGLESIHYWGRQCGAANEDAFGEFERLSTVLRSCVGLKEARLCCLATSTVSLDKILPAFANPSLERLRVNIDLYLDNPYELVQRPSSAIVLQPFSRGLMRSFPALKSLHIDYCDSTFANLFVDTEEALHNLRTGVVSGLEQFIRQEMHPSLERVQLDCRGVTAGKASILISFIMAVSEATWKVNVTTQRYTDPAHLGKPFEPQIGLIE